MALSYGFFDAELTPSGQYDRAYAAEHFAEYFHLIVSNGVFPDPATQLQVVASDTPNMNVNVSDGYGWINGYYAKNSGPYPLAIQAASGTLNRIDAVVLRWVNASRSMELAVKTGIAASAPTVPALQRDGEIYELMLASVTVAAGVTSITQSSITDKRSDTSVCGWVTGAVQNIDTTNLFAQYDDAFKAWFDNIKAQLGENVAANLQRQIDELSDGKVSISDKASESEAKAGVDNSKWMTPFLVKLVSDKYRTLAVGDVFHSANNVEEETGGAFIALDGRTIDIDTGYPLLKDAYELKYRVPNPTALNAGNITYNQSVNRGINIGGVYFWVNYQNNALMMRNTSGNVTKIATGISIIAECQGQLVCGTISGAYAKVYNTSGTLLRTITLNSNTGYWVDMVKVSGNRVWFGCNHNGTMYSWYSDDNFATYGSTIWNSWSTSYTDDTYQSSSNLLSNLWEYGGAWYFFTLKDTTYRVYKSTDKGASFSLYKTITGSTSNGCPYNSRCLIHDGYFYTNGYITETVSSSTYNRAVWLKYSLSTGALIGRSSIIYDSSLSGLLNGFVHEGWVYITTEYQSFKMNLDDLSWEPFVPYPGFHGGGTKANRIGDLYIITNLSSTTCIPTYGNYTSGVYNTIIVYHIPSRKSVCLYNGSYMPNASVRNCVGVPFEGENEIVIPCGYYSSNEYNYSGLIKIDLSLRSLPSLDYAYIKAKEVS